MKTRHLFLTALAAAFAVAAALSCSRLGDDAWMKIAFLSPGTETGLSVLSSSLGDDKADKADVKVTNWSSGSQGTGTGTGIDLYQVQVAYSYGSYSFPSYQYGVSANVPAGTAAGSESATLADIPIVPIALKDWLGNPANFPAATATGSFVATAKVTVLGRTAEGVDLSVTESLSIAFNSEAETISTPTTPQGSSSGGVGVSLGYSTGGAESDQGHALQYRFDWGDGTTSPWSSNISAFHAWSTSGTYVVKAQARCALHTARVSSWSNGLTVTISSVFESITTPNAPTGSPTGVINNSLSYSTGGSTSSLGHALQYRFDWGDGSTSSFVDATSASHPWVTAGTYSVKAQARCATDTTIVSNWSNPFTVTITTVK